MSIEKTAGLNRNSVPILGFGFYRSHMGNPWFHRQDYEDAIPDGPYKHLIIPSRSTVVNVQRSFRELNYLELDTSVSSPKGGRKQVMMRATDSSTEPLLEYLTFSVTHNGLTLPDILLIPESVQTILVDTDFTERVIRSVSGAVSAAQNQ